MIVGEHGFYRGLSESVMGEGGEKGSGGKRDNGAALMMWEGS